MNKMFFLVVLGALAGDHFEVLMEAGEIVETAFETELFDTDAVVDKEFTCMSYPDLRQELGIGFTCSGFKIPAKGIGDQACYGSYFFQVYFLGEMAECIVINGVDPLVL